MDHLRVKSKGTYLRKVTVSCVGVALFLFTLCWKIYLENHATKHDTKVRDRKTVTLTPPLGWGGGPERDQSVTKKNPILRNIVLIISKS